MPSILFFSGGDSDASSKGIFGVCHSQDNKFFLIVVCIVTPKTLHKLGLFLDHMSSVHFGFCDVKIHSFFIALKKYQFAANSIGSYLYSWVKRDSYSPL